MHLRLAAILAAVTTFGCGDDVATTPIDAAVTTDVVVDADGDGFPFDDDCNDNDAAVHPGAPELCNGVDDDCDSVIDDGLTTTFNDGASTVDVSGLVTGAPGAPVDYTPPSVGTLTLCGGPFYVRITATADLVIDGNSAAATVLDGDATGTPITVATAGTTVTIRDVTITHGKATNIWGTYLFGGGVFCKDATVHIDNVVIADNIAGSGVTSGYGGALGLVVCTLDVSDTVLSGNTADGGAGGGLATIGGGTATLTRVTATGNGTNGYGGAAAVLQNNGEPHLDLVDSVLAGNTALSGGGLYSEGIVTCTRTTTTAAITNNTGAGVRVASGSFTSYKCDFGITPTTNNSPADVSTNGGTYDYGDGAKFACTTSGCNL